MTFRAVGEIRALSLIAKDIVHTKHVCHLSRMEIDLHVISRQ